MPQNSMESDLQTFFAEATREDWKKAARAETQGKDPDEALSWRTGDDLEFLPYYSKENISGLPLFSPVQSSAGEEPLSRSTGWLNIPPVTAVDAAEGNRLALQHLSFGANGVMFDRKEFNANQLNTLLQGIDSSSCALCFIPDAFDFPEMFAAYVRENSNPASVRGAFFWESIPKRSNLDFFITSCPHFRATGVLIAPASPAVEISECLYNGVNMYESFANTTNAEKVMRSIAFCLHAESTLLENIAKLKALRMLWRHVAIAYGHHNYNSSDLLIHVRSLPVGDGLYHPHENMLKTTFAATAAVLGGCDALTLTPHEPRAFIHRWMRNVSLILKEEAFMGRTVDPVSGSYAIEVLTHALAEKAWKMFQSKCANV